MGIAGKNQTLQDWITQQWVILFGQKIDQEKHAWLLGPFGGIHGIGQQFIRQLAEQEQLVIDDQRKDKGLIQSIQQLQLSEVERDRLSPKVIDFYQHTANYDLQLKVTWNPFFKPFGLLLRLIFSKRIEQLNVPIESTQGAGALTSEIIQLLDPKTNAVARTVWLRTFAQTGQVVYSGVYATCTIPSGKTCIKAVFPLPNGNATVLLTPSVDEDGSLTLDSSGQAVGDSGFYFLLKDAKGQLWTKFISSFRDKLVVSDIDGRIKAVQTLTLWNLKVLEFEYAISEIEES